MVRAAFDLTPRWLRAILALDGHGLHAWELEVVRHIGALADRLVLDSNPAVQACRRLRLPSDYLYFNGSTPSSISAGHVNLPIERRAHDR